MEHREQTLKLANHDLMVFNLDSYKGPISPSGFGKQFGPQQNVDVVFTSDRTGPKWAAIDPQAGGFMDHYSFKEGGPAYGKVYVLAELTTRSKMMRGRNQAMLSMAIDPKLETIMCLVHELVHVRQAWLLPQDYNIQYQKAGPYGNNLFEQAAYSFAGRFVEQNQARIKQGQFDKYLPNWATR
jgi:hypothetical protein